MKILNTWAWKEAEKELGLDVTSEMEERKYVVLFEQDGQKQYASCDDPTDESEGWSLGLFEDDEEK